MNVKIFFPNFHQPLPPLNFIYIFISTKKKKYVYQSLFEDLRIGCTGMCRTRGIHISSIKYAPGGGSGEEKRKKKK